MNPDLQLEAYQRLFEDSVIESDKVFQHLQNEFQEADASVIREAIEAAKAARVAYLNAPSTYEQPSPSAAQDAAAAHLLAAVPNISDRLLSKLIGGTMKDWLY